MKRAKGFTMKIEGKFYERFPGFIGGARIVRAKNGRIAGHIVRSYKSNTSTMVGWRFLPSEWTGLETRYFNAAMKEIHMVKALERVDL